MARSLGRFANRAVGLLYSPAGVNDYSTRAMRVSRAVRTTTMRGSL